MSKTEFLTRLEYLLSDIPEEERKEALEFYRSYFEDAGEEREEAVIRELGNPERVAAQIKAGLSGDNSNAGEYTEWGYREERFRENRQMPRDIRKKGMNGWKIFGIITLCIVGIPIVLPILATIFGLLVAVVGVLFAIGVSILALTAAGLVSGVILLAVGISRLAAAPAIGMLMCGGGFLAFAVGILLILLTALVLGKGIPAVWQGAKVIFKKAVHRKGGEGV